MIKKGSFVRIGNDVGVVVFQEHENRTPEDHLAIWFGETDENNIPKYKSVPEDYCEIIPNPTDYH